MSIESPIVTMAGRREKPKKGQKSQEELREAITARFEGLGNKTRQDLDTYDRMLKDGSFDDKDSEAVGAGEERKNRMQTDLSFSVDRLENMKGVLDSGEDLPQSAPSISVVHTYKNEKGKDVNENINLSLEDTMAKAVSLYQKTGIDLPPDFQEQVETIWQNNYDAIVEAVEKDGFNEILLAPANIPLTELSEKMKMGKGYGDFIDSGGGTVTKLPGTTIVSQDTDKTRLILVHKAQSLGDRPSLKKTLNIKAIDTDIADSLSLDDYIIFQRQYFEENGKYLDKDSYSTWTPKSKSGARFVYSYWDPAGGSLVVGANDPGNQLSFLGCRPSRYFF